MSSTDRIGRINVSEIAPSGSFPLIPDYGSGTAVEPEIQVFPFGSGNAKIEQRFVLGNGVRRFTVRHAVLNKTEIGQIADFWELNKGAYGAFTYNDPDGQAYTCRFADPTITFDYLLDDLAGIGVTLVELPTATASYALNNTCTRFPSATLQTALQDQVQVVIPIIKIRVREQAVNDIYLSDRRVTIGGITYLPRLVDCDGISQGITGESDEATFTFGNADRVMAKLANDTDLWRATIEFSLFHVGTGTKLDLWRGEVKDWSFNSGPEFKITASDGIYELTLPYPTRRISRTCWKMFKDGINCPYAGALTGCNKSWADCQARGMEDYFGGIIAKPQAVRTKDNSTGHFGYGRSPLTSVSLVADSIYNEVLPEIYCDREAQPMPVNCKIAAGRDEGDFYAALGIVGQGPLGKYSSHTYDGVTNWYHTLDGQPPHGPNKLGLRESLGHDPVRADDPDPNSKCFSLGEGGEGPQIYGPEKAAGVAFVEIRRKDEKGLQISKLTEHQMQAYVAIGLPGWVWSGPGQRSLQPGLTNPIWIAVNSVLRARGLWNVPDNLVSLQEALFDVPAAVSAAAVCDQMVTSMFADFQERQFSFQGILQEEKPLRDWVQEILMNCLGYYTFSFGKLKLGTRYHSGATAAFTEGNIVFNSLELSALKPEFNHLTATFADSEYDFVSNSITLYDADHAARTGGATSPLFTKGNLNLSGTYHKSQAARIITARLREELGGADATEQRKARQIAFKTTVLALDVEPGMVCSMTHPDMPDGYGEFRVIGWKLNKDYSIDLQGRTTTDSMYSLISGDKPADVAADPIPDEDVFAPADWGFGINVPGGGKVQLKEFFCATNASTVHQGTFDIFHVPEASTSLCVLSTAMDGTTTTLGYTGDPPVTGEWILIDGELMEVVSVTPTSGNTGTAKVKRGQLGTTPVAHGRVSSAVSSYESNNAVLNVSGAFVPGNTIVTNPAGEWRIIGSYDNGKLGVQLPFTDLAGQSVYSDPRIYRVVKKTVVIPFAPRFFKSAGRAEFVQELDLPDAGLVAVKGCLENTRGIKSEPVIKSGFRFRTMGHNGIALIHPVPPQGLTENAFEAVRVPASQACEHAHAEVRNTSTVVEAPRAITTIARGDIQPGGTITLSSGILNPKGTVKITIGEKGKDRNYVSIPTQSYDGTMPLTGSDPTAAVVANLTAFLNTWDEFSAFFSAEMSGAVISITDKTGLGGKIIVQATGDITATALGMTPYLNVITGRRYACSFSTGQYESDLSPLSESTGPTGGAHRVELKDLPVSGDSRVTTLNVYATPDGQLSPIRLAASVPNGTTEAVDITTEAALAAQSAYAGPVQPTVEGECRITVRRDGDQWFELRLKDGKSNTVDGLALGALAEGTVVTADVDNSLPEGELRVFID